MFEGLYDRLSRLKGRSMHERNLQTGSRPLLSGVLHFNHNGREPADALILVGWCLKQLLAEKPKWPSCLHFTAKRMRDFCMTPSILGQTYMNAPSSQCGSTPTNAKLRKSRCGPSHWTKWRSYRPWSKLSYCGFTLYVPNPLTSEEGWTRLNLLLCSGAISTKLDGCHEARKQAMHPTWDRNFCYWTRWALVDTIELIGLYWHDSQVSLNLKKTTLSFCVLLLHHWLRLMM